MLEKVVPFGRRVLIKVVPFGRRVLIKVVPFGRRVLIKVVPFGRRVLIKVVPFGRSSSNLPEKLFVYFFELLKKLKKMNTFVRTILMTAFEINDINFN